MLLHTLSGYKLASERSPITQAAWWVSIVASSYRCLLPQHGMIMSLHNNLFFMYILFNNRSIESSQNCRDRIQGRLASGAVDV